jgi:hypothetical protein
MRKGKKAVLPAHIKEFQKVKRFVQKRFPGASTVVNSDGFFSVVDSTGRAVVSEALYIPPAKTVREAWLQAKYCHWYSNMIRKSNNAFSDEKIYKKLAKEAGEE